jgi:hypothetical protein
MFLAIDQYNQTHFLKTKYPRKELLDIFNAKSARKIFCDDKNGNIFHVGYYIRGMWLTIYEIKEFKKLT